MTRLAAARSIALILAVGLAAVACDQAATPTEQPGPGESPTETRSPGPGESPTGEPGPGGADEALRVRPVRGLQDPTPQPWDHVEVAADGRTLTVYYWGGVDECYTLARVRVARDPRGRLVIRIFEGTRPEQADRACIEIAVLKAVTVRLDQVLIRNPG